MQSQDPQSSEVLKVKLEGEQSVQSMLGIKSGGADALTALSLLCGGDYAIKGAEHVGSKSAVRMLQHLLQGQQVCNVQVYTHTCVYRQTHATPALIISCLTQANRVAVLRANADFECKESSSSNCMPHVGTCLASSALIHSMSQIYNSSY